jgi:hypothetical protein
LSHGGGRRVVGVVVGAALIYWFIQLREIKIWHVLSALLMTGTLLFFLQLMLEYRNVGFQEIYKKVKKILEE